MCLSQARTWISNAICLVFVVLWFVIKGGSLCCYRWSYKRSNKGRTRSTTIILVVMSLVKRLVVIDIRQVLCTEQDNVIHHLTICSAVLYHSQWQKKWKITHMSLVLSVSLCHGYQLYIKVHITTWKISQHVYAGFNVDDSMWSFWVVSNRCMFLLSYEQT